MLHDDTLHGGRPSPISRSVAVLRPAWSCRIKKEAYAREAVAVGQTAGWWDTCPIAGIVARWVRDDGVWEPSAGCGGGDVLGNCAMDLMLERAWRDMVRYE